MNYTPEMMSRGGAVERIAQIVYFGFLTSIVTMVLFFEFKLQPAPRQLNQMIYIVLVGMAVVSTNVVYMVRNRYVVQSEQVLRSEPANRDAATRRLTGLIITFAMCESIAIYGLVLRLIGGTRVICLVLYAVALYTLFMNRPKPISEQGA